MSNKGFLKLVRSETTLELLRRNPNAFLLLTQIAYRARRSDNFSALDLKQGQALIGDYENCGLTEQKYRTAKKNLVKWKFITTKTTSKGTIATLINTDVFDINMDAPNDQVNTPATTEQRAGNEQVTTNKKLKNLKKEKNEKKKQRKKLETPEQTELSGKNPLGDLPDIPKPKESEVKKAHRLLTRNQRKDSLRARPKLSRAESKEKVEKDKETLRQQGDLQ